MNPSGRTVEPIAAFALETISARLGFVAEAVRKLGRLDVLVNNARIRTYQKVTEASDASWDEMPAFNLKSYALCVAALAWIGLSGAFPSFAQYAPVSLWPSIDQPMEVQELPKDNVFSYQAPADARYYRFILYSDYSNCPALGLYREVSSRCIGTYCRTLLKTSPDNSAGINIYAEAMLGIIGNYQDNDRRDFKAGIVSLQTPSSRVDLLCDNAVWHVDVRGPIQSESSDSSQPKPGGRIGRFPN